MKKFKLFIILFLLISSHEILPENKKLTVDKTLAVIYHPDGTSVILQSDLKPGLEGVERTIKEVVLDRLFALDGEINLKITISPKDVDTHLIQVQEANKWTQEDTLKIFKDMGYTKDEACEQLRLRLLIDNTIDYRVKSKVIVDKKDIEKFYNANPIQEEASFTIAQAFVPFDIGSKAIKKANIEDAIESGEILNLVEWGAPLELKANQFAQDKSFIKELEPGKVVILSETDDGINLLRLISKKTERLVPLAERVNAITNELGKERYNKVFNDYKSELLAKAHVKYLTDTVEI